MTNRWQQLSRKDQEQLSAYLDGELSPGKAAQMEARLREEPRLQKALNELQATTRLLASLPAVKPPRNFVLTPEMAGQTQSRGRYPFMQLATAMAALAFLIVVGFDALTSTGTLGRSGALPMAAEAPMAQELAQPEAMSQAEDQAEADLEQPLEEPQMEMEELPAEALEEELGDTEAQPQAEAFEAEVQGTPPPTTGGAASTAGALDEAAEGEQERAAAPVPTETAHPTITPSPTELVSTEFADGPTEGNRLARNVLRWTEIGLAALVIILAGMTLRMRPQTK